MRTKKWGAVVGIRGPAGPLSLPCWERTWLCDKDTYIGCTVETQLGPLQVKVIQQYPFGLFYEEISSTSHLFMSGVSWQISALPYQLCESLQLQ